MNKRINIVAASILFIVVLFSVLAHLSVLSNNTDSFLANTNSTVLELETDKIWKTVLNNSKQFKKIEKPTADDIESKPAFTLLDAKLVAIISGQKESIRMLLPDSEKNVPVTFEVGSSWLEGWMLSQIERDRITWVHTESSETVVQFMFK